MMALVLVAASAYSSGQVVGEIFGVVLVAAIILHFWKSGPTRNDLTRPQAPPQRTLSTYGQEAPPPVAPQPQQAPPARPAGGRPPWGAPVVWSIAVVVAVVLVASHKDPASLSDKDKKGFVAGCTASVGGRVDCACLLDQLFKRGYDTKPELNVMAGHIYDATAANSPASLPPDFVASVQACQTSQ
jgi:hypothetical protein